jgi:hypothetical protein
MNLFPSHIPRKASESLVIAGVSEREVLWGSLFQIPHMFAGKVLKK